MWRGDCVDHVSAGFTAHAPSICVCVCVHSQRRKIRRKPGIRIEIDFGEIIRGRRPACGIWSNRPLNIPSIFFAQRRLCTSDGYPGQNNLHITYSYTRR